MSLFRGSAPLVMPPSPIFVPEGSQSDAAAVALLFGDDQTASAPSLNEPSTAAAPRPSQQPSAWRVVGARTSLFDDHIKDPPPPRVASPVVDEGSAEDVAHSKPAPAVAARKGPPPTPPAAVLAGKNAKQSRGRSAESAATDTPEAPVLVSLTKGDAEKPTKTRKLRTLGGPDKSTLAVLGAGSLLVLGVAGVLLGVISNPFARPRAAVTAPRSAGPAVPTAKAPSPVSASAPSPAQLPKPATPTPTTAPQAATPPIAVAATPTPTPPKPSDAPKVAASTVAATAPAAKAAAVVTKAAPTPAAKDAAAAPAATAQPASETRQASPPAQAATADEPSGGEALISAARKKLADDEPQAAEALLRQALAKDPQDHHAMELLARALMDQDRGQEALPFARKIVQRRPRRIPYRLLLGDLLLMVGDEAHAKLEWEEARKLAPDDPQIKRRLGQ
jgi:predicted negative regulator of RcsB-dependent stress response